MADLDKQKMTIDCIVCVGGSGTDLGRMTFAAIPRKGEFISVDDEDGVGQAYVVVAVNHSSSGGVDLWVEHWSTITDLNARLKSGSDLRG